MLDNIVIISLVILKLNPMLTAKLCFKGRKSAERLRQRSAGGYLENCQHSFIYFSVYCLRSLTLKVIELNMFTKEVSSADSAYISGQLKGIWRTASIRWYTCLSIAWSLILYLCVLFHAGCSWKFPNVASCVCFHDRGWRGKLQHLLHTNMFILVTIWFIFKMTVLQVDLKIDLIFCLFFLQKNALFVA